MIYLTLQNLSRYMTLRSGISLFALVILNACVGDEDVTGFIRPGPSVSSVDYQPSWSPNGEWIAYRHGPADNQGSGVHIIRPDGSERRLIIDSSEYPDWAPSGTELVVKRFYNSQFHLVQIPSGISNVLTHDSLSKLCPSWHPSEKKIAFSIHAGPDSIAGIWEYAIIDSIYTRILPIRGIDPDWSPTGNRLVFIREFSILALFDYSTEITEDLIEASVLSSHALWYPSFSPDGEKIVFHTNPTSSQEAIIWIYNLSDKSINKVMVGGIEPSWSPDGLNLVYVRHLIHRKDVVGNGYLWILNLLTGYQSHLTHP